MKKYKIITIIAGIAIIMLQSSYISSIYGRFIQDMTLKIDRACKIAIDEEMLIRQLRFNRLMLSLTKEQVDSIYQIIPRAEFLDIDIEDYRKLGVIETSGDINTHNSEDKHFRLNDLMDMPVLDSLFCASVPIELPHRFTLFDKEMQATDSIGNSHITHINYTKYQPLGLRGLQSLQLDAEIPLEVFVKDEIGSLLLSLLIMLIALGCVLFQLTVIRNKEEELKQRDEATRYIVHDLKTPITTAMTIAETMKALNDDKLLHEAMDYNYNKFNHVLQQVEELKDATSEDGTKYELQMQQVNLFKIAEQVKEECDLLFADKEHSVNIVNNLPEGYEIRANVVMIERAMRNLVENGLKYSDHGVEVEIKLNKTVKGVLVEVQDNGWGIEEKYLKKIFKLYYRIPLEGDYERRGSGVGLSSAKSAVLAHGGKIWVKSEPGIGSTFSFTIPHK